MVAELYSLLHRYHTHGALSSREQRVLVGDRASNFWQKHMEGAEQIRIEA